MSQAKSVHDLTALKGQRPIKSITAYDYYGAKMAETAEMDFILVGDSLGMVIQGNDNTLSVTLEQMIYHLQAVVKGAPNTLVVADMPYLTFHLSSEDTIRNAAALMVAGAQAVKIEGGEKRVPMIQACLQAEIPVMGHIGLTPQSVNQLGGFKVQRDREFLLKEAQAVVEAGAFAMVLEGMPVDLAQEITKEVKIPTIGIGAGAHCDGQILVFHDVLGFNSEYMPKFVKKYADQFSGGVEALKTYGQEVMSRKFPGDEHTYKAKAKEAR